MKNWADVADKICFGNTAKIILVRLGVQTSSSFVKI